MRGARSIWAMQLPSDGVPKGGDWDLSAAVRVAALPGHDSEHAVRVGSAPSIGVFTAATIGELDDGAFHPVTVPGGPHHWEHNHPHTSSSLPSSAQLRITWAHLVRIDPIRHAAQATWSRSSPSRALAASIGFILG
jgi:hypothetical protein